MPLNPNVAHDAVNAYTSKTDADKVKSYPQFLMEVELNSFRHIHGLKIDFTHPVSVISGSNRSGKTSVLMTIACSHYNFDRPDVANGAWKRATWSHLVRFTPHDSQSADWIYHIMYREGDATKTVEGYRRCATKKWGGAGKKEGQIGKPTSGHVLGGRHVCLIDLNRINPGRHLTTSTYAKARRATGKTINNQDDINKYLSYIFETDYDISKLTEAADNMVFQFREVDGTKYSSFNTASGEDALVNLLNQILHLPENSLILIDELEIGLHPKIQRRLMDIIYIISQKQHKQFIITSHSYAVIDSVPAEARIFIEHIGDTFECKKGLSTYETLTRMDSEAFPVVTFYVEDDVSQKIVDNAIKEINQKECGFARLARVVVVGSADCTYNYSRTRNKLRGDEKITTKAACILDGDMNGNAKYPPENNLFFHYSSEAPEKMLVKAYLNNNADTTLQYHVDNSNPHYLFKKMAEMGLATDTNDAFDKCFNAYRQSDKGGAHFEQLKDFIKRNCSC